MARKEDPKNYNLATKMPDEINNLKATVKEFIHKVEAVDNEIELLKGDRKEIFEEYSEKLDMKTLKAAMAVIRIQRGVAHRDAYDLFMAALEDPTP